MLRNFHNSQYLLKISDILADKRPHKREKFKLNGLREKPPALAGFIKNRRFLSVLRNYVSDIFWEYVIYSLQSSFHSQSMQKSFALMSFTNLLNSSYKYSLFKSIFALIINLLSIRLVFLSESFFFLQTPLQLCGHFSHKSSTELVTIIFSFGSLFMTP